MSSSSIPKAPQENVDWTPGQGMVVNRPPVKRKDDAGNYDVTTPASLLDTKTSGLVAIVTSGETRHKDQERIVEHWARQQAAKKAGTYDPLEDPPVQLSDIVPQVFVVINKVFSEAEMTIQGEAGIKAYIDKLKEHIDFDIIPVLIGKQVLKLPMHANIPKEHRDPILNAQMQQYYKDHDKGHQEILKRVMKAQAESKRQIDEQRKKALEQAALEHAKAKQQ